MKLLEYGGNIVDFARLGDEFSSSIVDRLQIAYVAVWKPSENAVAIIKLDEIREWMMVFVTGRVRCLQI